MAITYYAGNRWTGTSSDRAGITTGNITAGLTFLETNTDDLYQWDGDSWNVIAGDTVAQTLVNKTLTSPVLTTPQINDTSADHQYVFAVSELAADRVVTLPLLTAGDTLAFNNHAATFQNKTLVHGSNGNSVTGLVNASLSGSAAITNANLANSTITMAATAGSSDAIALGETFTFTAGEGIDTTMGSNAVTIAAEDATDSNKGIASFSTDNFTVSSGVVTIKDSGVNNDELAGSIANAKLANSAITIGGTATSLGGTITALTALTDLDLTAGNKTIFDTVGANTLTIGASNTTISIPGNLTIGGTTTTVNSTTVTVDDPIITLGGDSAPGSDDNKDRGVEFRYHDGSSARVGFFGFDDSATTFTGFTAATNNSEVFSGTVMNAVFGNVTAATQSANNNSTYAATTAYVQAELTAYAADTVTFTNKSLSGEQVNSGTVADARIAATLSRIAGTETLTNKTLTSPVLNGTLSGTAFLDEDNFASNSAIAVASQQSIAAYIATQITAEDLDVTSDSGTIDIDLNSETLTIAGGTGLASAASGTTVTLNIDSTVATLTGTQTLTNKTLTAPKIANAGFIADANGAEQIIFATTSSAVNELTITNGATGNPAQIAASGETNIGLKLAGKGTEGVILTNATANGAFLEFDTKAAPANPSAEQARLYLKEVDSNNNALAVKIQKAGAIVEVEITSPKAVCGVCGSKDGASDPTYDFSRDVMILDLWCGHSFEVPMQQWSHINGNS